MNQAIAPLVIPGYRSGTWKIDPSQSTISFAIRQLFGRARGRFAGYDATIVTGERQLESSLTATIDLASIDTGNQKRDEHLRRLLKVEQYPTMTYRSTGLQRDDDGWVVNGRLALHDILVPVPLALEEKGFSTDLSGRECASFLASTRISRRDFGLGIPMAAGGVIVSDKVSIRLQIEAVRSS